MAAIASDPIHLGTHPATWNRVAIDQGGVRDYAVVNRTRAVTLTGGVRAIGRDDLDVSVSLWSWSTLMDGVMFHMGSSSIPYAHEVRSGQAGFSSREYHPRRPLAERES